MSSMDRGEINYVTYGDGDQINNSRSVPEYRREDSTSTAECCPPFPYIGVDRHSMFAVDLIQEWTNIFLEYMLD
jgi:hypothetical protein